MKGHWQALFSRVSKVGGSRDTKHLQVAPTYVCRTVRFEGQVGLCFGLPSPTAAGGWETNASLFKISIVTY